MSLTKDDVKKIAQLAKLCLSETDTSLYTHQLSNIFDFVAQMNEADTSQINLTEYQELTQRLRPDIITERDQRAEFQKIAPLVQAGLYLVPKVIEDGQ